MNYLNYTQRRVKNVKTIKGKITYELRAQLEFNWAAYSVDFRECLASFLEEKGADWVFGYVDATTTTMALRAPRKMYHAVIVPGLLHLCKQWHMSKRADEYFENGEDRELRIVFTLKQKELWELAAEKIGTKK